MPDREYPVGTILQLVPFEAMVKHPREKFPKTNGWEFFFLDVSEAGTKIKDRGDNVVNVSQGVACLSCHQPAARFDFVCEKGHGCAPIPLDDQKMASFRVPTLVVPRSRGWVRERFPITWNHVIEMESLNINKLEHVPHQTSDISDV